MNYLLVKGWAEFQHYKDRLPPWIKLHRELLTDYDFGHLPDETKSHLMMIWLLASQMDGRVPDDSRWIAARIGANKPVNMRLLIDQGWLIAEQTAPVEREKWPSRYVSEDLRAEVLDRDGHKCRTCSATELLEIDHIVPVSKGGEGKFENLQVLCRTCNRRKRTTSAEQPATQIRSLETETYKATETETEARAGIPPWLPKTAWQDFVTFRRKQKGWTLKAEVLLLRELTKLRDAGFDPVAVIEQSIANGWKGLFPLRSGTARPADARAVVAEAIFGKRDEQPGDITGEAQRIA